MLGQMQTSGGSFWVGVGGGSEIFVYYLPLPPKMFTYQFLLEVKISTFGVPKDRIAGHFPYVITEDLKCIESHFEQF